MNALKRLIRRIAFRSDLPVTTRDPEGWITPPTEEPLWRGPIDPGSQVGEIPVAVGNPIGRYGPSIPWDAPTTATPVADLNRIAKEAREIPGTLTMDEWVERQNRDRLTGKRYRFDGPEPR